MAIGQKIGAVAKRTGTATVSAVQSWYERRQQGKAAQQSFSYCY